MLDLLTCEKATRSIGYQSCEFDGWKASAACRALNAMHAEIEARIGAFPAGSTLADARKGAWSLSAEGANA